jgi:hypothetical protein
MIELGPSTSFTMRVVLIKRWSRWFAEHTEDWEGRLGTELAYLFQAIANDIAFVVDIDSPLLALLREKRVRRHDRVWRYVRSRSEVSN